MNAVIVDDEPLARELIREYLADYPHIHVLAEVANGTHAVETINGTAPDLVFLDIQMPGLSGFEVLSRLEFLPAVVFSTAHDEFALRAFEVNAVDYLLKPYDRQRFAEAVGRALKRVESDEVGSLQGLLRQTIDQDFLLVRVGRKIVPVALKDVLWIEAAGSYAQLHTSGRTYLCGATLGALEERLRHSHFLRVHRSAIVATPAIAHLESDGEGGFLATLKNGPHVRQSLPRRADTAAHRLTDSPWLQSRYSL